MPTNSAPDSRVRAGLEALRCIGGIPVLPDPLPEEALRLGGLAWDALSGVGEAGVPTDRCGNPLASGTARASRLFDTPVDDLARQLGALVPGSRRPAWPEGAPYALALSHDLDDPLKGQLVYGLGLVASGLLKRVPHARREGWDRARTWWRSCRGAPDPYFTFAAIRDLEAAEGVRSTFFGVSILDGDWEVRVSAAEEPVRSALKEAVAGGWEAGLHGSNASASDGARLRAERVRLEEALGSPVTSLRQHNLRWRGPAAWVRQAEAGFLCDSSVGFNEACGFRSGTSFPFPAFSPEGRILPVIEVPHVMMDKLGPDPEAEIGMLLGTLRRTGGCAAVNWHEHAFCREDFPGRAEVYRSLVRSARRDGAWLAPVGELARWWRERTCATS